MDAMAGRLYDLRRWRTGRARHLRDNPLCVMCKSMGIITVAGVVDHNPPHKNDFDKFFDEATWTSLCKQCHDSMTARADGGFGNRQINRAAITLIGCDSNGLPKDKKHHWAK